MLGVRSGMAEKARIAGVGMTRFVKPGMAAYRELGAEAARTALADSGIDYSDVEQAYVGYVYGDSTRGQSALYEVGVPGPPIINLHNNCLKASRALFLAHQPPAT